MAQQTSVEWLFEKMAQTPMTNWYEIREKALAMEKEQIINSYKEGHFHLDFDTYSPEEYYNETYNK